MPPRASPAAASSVFNFTSLLQSLPSTSRNQAFTKCSTCLFSTTAPLEAKRAKKHKERVHRDPYREAQALQRKSANIARQKVLKAERQSALGDPVRSRSAPFVDTLHSSTVTESTKQQYLNYFLKAEDVQKNLEYSKWLTEPLQDEHIEQGEIDPKEQAKYAAKVQRHAEEHENASQALLAIAAVENGSSKDRVRLNIQRCIEEFGRHNTSNF